jgi:hypothetical protein
MITQPQFAKGQRVTVLYDYGKEKDYNYTPVRVVRPYVAKVTEVYYCGCFGFRYDLSTGNTKLLEYCIR